ncbi:UNVERIFIED_CONTAM: hypothetical protein GTU68_045444 [Idotea baltica]|nr:hypothetical protein [Idotea baltica]
MIHRGKSPTDIHSGKYNGLGGKLEAGEDPQAGVVREVLEESGLKIRNPQLVGTLTFPKFKDNEDWYVYVYIASEFSGQLRSCAEGEVSWINDSQILDLPLWEGDKVFLPLLYSGNFFSGSFTYVDKKLVAKQCYVYEQCPGEIIKCIE